MNVSGHVRELTHKKATMVMIFLKYMRERDNDVSHFEVGAKHAIAIAAEVGELLGVSKNSVYRAGRTASGKWGRRHPTTTAAPNLVRFVLPDGGHTREFFHLTRRI